jgi:hypothetical protein
MAENANLLAHYTQHSAITDPRGYARLFDDLPRGIAGLVQVVQGLLFHLLWADAYGRQVPADGRGEIYLRTVPQMLERILALDPAPLGQSRPPELRKVSICRDYAVLLVAMLRQQGTPARLRVGFAGYFAADVPRYWDHRIAEYWDAGLQRWVLVDPQVDAVMLGRLRKPIDPLHVTADSPFLVAGDVWQRCRAGLADPNQFGDAPDDLGMPPIRYALLHDFDALNKAELVGFDTWHPLIDKPEAEVTEEERLLLDDIAQLTTQVNSRFADLGTLYNTTAYGRAVQARLATL